MRTVLYLVGSSGFGGVETFIKSTQAGHDQRRYRPVYFCLRDGPLVTELKKMGAHVHVAQSHFRLRNPLSYLRCIWEITALAGETKAGVLHSSMAYMALIGAPAAAAAGIPHVWFQHGPVGGWMDWLAGMLPARAILFNSQYTLRKQLERHSFCGKKISGKARVLYLGTSSGKSSVLRARERFRIVMLCRAQGWKGPDIFIEALKGLQKKGVAFEASLYLADEGGSYRQELKRMAEDVPSLKIEPPIADTREVLASADCVVNASRTPEPFGLTLIEAMSAGVVPVAPRAGGPVEIITDGETGLLFESGSSVDLAEKLAVLAGDRTQCDRLGQNARQEAGRRFSLETMMRTLENYYDAL